MDGEVVTVERDHALQSSPVRPTQPSVTGNPTPQPDTGVTAGRARPAVGEQTEVGRGVPPQSSPNLAAAQLGDQVTRQPPTSRQPGQQPGVLTGMLRAVQTLPAAVENLVARSSSSRSGQGTPGQLDSVECASVRTSAERPTPPPPPELFQEGPLLDATTLQRMQEMASRAPLLYPSASSEYVDDLRMGPHDSGFVGPQTPPPPSTASSELQAEVRRQLSELMGIRDEESRRLRTPVTLASLSAQLDQLRSLARDPEVKVLAVDPRPSGSTPAIETGPHHKGVTLQELGAQLGALRTIAEELDIRVCREEGRLKTESQGALLDSGATHAVIPYDSKLKNLEQVPVTLAGDAKQNWWRTKGGTLVVPPGPEDPISKPAQTILPLGALVESLGCQVRWSRRKGLRVIHPSLGVLNTGVSANTCPYVQEDQALRLIAELESQRLEGFKREIQNLECQLEIVDAPPDPTEALRCFSNSGLRSHALRAFLAQPYLASLPEEIKVGLAEDFPANSPDVGRSILKLLPLKRAARRVLDASDQWVVHLCSGPSRDNDPLIAWCNEMGFTPLQVDLQQPGGRGWDLTRPNGVWKVLVWAASRGKAMLLWSLASVGRGVGIPYALLRAFEAESSIASEPPNDQEEEPLGASGVGDFDPPLSPIEKEELQQHAREGPGDASAADPKVHTCPRLSAAELEAWRKHVQNGHVPYRRDCKQCVEGAGLGPFHRRVKYPRSFALSVDLFGPVPLKEAGRDESCVTGKNVLRYGLVGAFRVPQSFVHTPEGVDGVKDLCTRDGVVEPTLEDELAEYEPSEVGSDPNPNIPLPDSLDALFSPDHPEPPLAAGVAPEEAPESQSLLDGEDLPCSNEELQELVEELRQPVNQVVLRYFIPLRTKTGAEVSEALQRLILGINQRFPVRSIHHDPGTEFSSTSLSRWLAQHGVRVQHSLPTDKKGNGLSERTVGWVKSRIRTLLKGANLAVGWWPLAARWAVCKHNALILGESTLPAFGQTVLHRLKRPADGAKQLMERWVEARYGAPHRSIPEGHILITSAGTLVASKGFKSEVIDPTKVKELDLSVLQEQEHMLEEQDEVFDDQGRPLKRLKGKTSVRFVECIASPTSEELAHDFLVLQDYSLEAIRKVLAAIVQEEESTDDRRGIVEGKYILGAYCHGGLRGVAQAFIQQLRQTWECTGLKEATAQDPLRFLGVDIFAELGKGGEVLGYSLAQESYIAELLRSHEIATSSRATAPVPKDWVRDLPAEEDSTEGDLRSSQRITGELLWLSQRSRLDIAYCVGMMASWVAKFPQHVLKIGLRVLEYLGNTRAHRLRLIPGRPEGLRIFTDASFAPHGSHSVTGIVLQYDECSVVWKSKRQSLVTLSTAESELVSGCEGVVMAQSLEALICEIEESSCTKRLMVDNTAAVTLATGGGSQRTRHLRVRSAFIRDMIDREEIEVLHCPGDLQLADCLTKALLKARLEELCKLLGLGPPQDPSKIARVVSQVPEAQPLGDPTRVLTPSGVEPIRSALLPAGTGSNQDHVRAWLTVLVFLLQAELGDALAEDEIVGEPLNLELPFLVVLMVLSVLFLWESARFCLGRCCTRRDDAVAVRMVSADDEDEQRQVRRGRRQETVRRAIARELDGEGLRQRAVVGEGHEPLRVPDAPFLRVQVEAQHFPSALDLPPPPPPDHLSMNSPDSVHHVNPPPTPYPGTPVTLASLSAQLDQLRSLARDPEVKVLAVDPRPSGSTPAIETGPHHKGVTLQELGAQLGALRTIAEELDIRVCREEGRLKTESQGALLDSGATHAVIPYDSKLKNLEQVPVTLAGDAKQNWWRTKGGTLVVPPGPEDPISKPAQTILPLGALVESLGCQVRWSRRKGLRVIHPSLGVLNTGVSANTCPYVQEDQALRLIAELESQRLEGFKREIQNLECQLEIVDAPPDPTEALRCFSNSGLRSHALRAFLAQPYLASLPEEIKVGLAEDFPANSPDVGRSILKLLPLKRAARRVLDASDQWVVHLCSGPSRDNDPLIAWCNEMGFTPLQVDLQQPGGRGWDLTRPNGVWKVLVWAASRGKAMLLWSLASVGRGVGIPYALLRAFEAESSIASEPPNDQEEEPLGASGVGDFDPPLSPIEKEELQQHAREGPGDASAADPKVHTCPRLSAAELEAWRKHVQNGHVPYRRDCKQCVEGAGLGPFHRRVKYPRSFALSVDLFGPVPLKEAGRDESCVTGKNVLRYGLVGAFRVPQSFVHTPEGVDGVKDLCTRDGVVEPTLEDELAEYEPSEVGSDPNPNIPLPDSLDALFSPDHPEPPLAAGVAPEEAPESQSLLDGEDLPCSNEELQELVEELRQPVNQVVLRYFIPLRTKTGAEVSEALQRLILGINQRFPVRSIHHDPGTEFSSTSLSRWLAQHGVRVQHSLPTDKKGNGLSERTVGWVKSRIRTLLKGANLAVGWWPLAARWAVCKHNALILGESTLPAFGQTVLHRLKRPADGAKQLMERWVEARYGAPHRSIPEGHILITSAGTLVASKGFKSEVIDPTKVKELDLSVLQEQEHMLEEQDEVFDDQGRPLKRLKGKTSVRFVECIASPTSEELAHDFLVLQDYSLEAIRKVLAAIVQEEESTDDRRGIVEGKYILGAYCHGGLRGTIAIGSYPRFVGRLRVQRIHLRQLAAEGNVWSMRNQDGTCVGHLLVYVDDMLLLTDPEVAQAFIQQLRQTWECTGLKEATAQDPLRFLGVDIFAELGKGGEVLGYSLAQESYIAELLRSHEIATSSRATAPVPKDWVRDLPAEEDSTEGDLRSSQRITGELLWLSQRSRLDIAYCVGMMASWVAKFPQHVLKIGLRVLEYLGNTRAHRLRLIPGRPEGLRIFTDASFAPHGSHSVTGIVLQYDECSVVWKSKRQSLVTLSTAESELVSGCEGVVMAQSLEALICEIEESSCTKRLMVDNTAAVTLATGGGSQRTRHLRVRSAFIRDMIDREEIEVLHCPGDLQLADCLTKALLKARLEELCKLLGLGPPQDPSKIARVVSQVPEAQPLGDPTRVLTPSGVEPIRSALLPAGTGSNQDHVRAWLTVLVFLLQAELGDALAEDEIVGEPLNLELPFLVVLMVLSVLFLWESARFCLGRCCTRRDDAVAVRMVSADDEDEQRQVRRGRRQETVRRAIARELDGEGLRQRAVVGEGHEPLRVPDAPFLRVQVEAQHFPSALDLPPPPPPDHLSMNSPDSVHHVNPPPTPYPGFTGRKELAAFPPKWDDAAEEEC
eukprot:s2292_g1.t1